MKTKIKNYLDRNYNILIYISLFLFLIYPFNISILNLKIPAIVYLGVYTLSVALLFLLHFEEIIKNFKKKYLIGIFISLFIILVLIKNQDLANGFKASPFFTCVALVIIYILSHSKKWINPFINVVLIYVSQHIFFTILFYFTPNFYLNNILPLFPDTYNELLWQFNHKQMAGLTYHYSTNAIYLLIAVIFTYIKFNLVKNKKSKIFFLIMLIFAIIALFLTGKRSHTVFLIVSFIVVYFIKNIKSIKNMLSSVCMIGIIAIIGILAIRLIAPFMLNPFIRIFDSIKNETIWDTRNPMFNLALEMLKSSTLFGCGWGSFKYRYHNTIINKEMEYMETHNIYLQLLAETGVVGLVVFIVAIFLLFVYAIKRLNYNKKYNNYITIFLLLLIYVLLEGLIGNPIYDIQMYMPFTLCIAMMLSLEIKPKDKFKGENMKKNKIISISIAAYNMEKLIDQCITSFINEKIIDDVELIITDDGGKDNTMKIAEGYSKKYPGFIKLVKKENEGPGSTVNCGIKNATGKYFRMVDGDDWVDTKNFVELVEYLKNCDDDMVVCDYSTYDNKENKISQTITTNMPELNSFNFDDVYLKLPYEMHSTIYKTEIYQKNNIVIDNCFHTDVEYQLMPIPYVKTVSYFNKVIYMYRIAQAGQSVSPKSLKKNVNQHHLVLKTLINYYYKNKENLTEGQSYYITNRLGKMAYDQMCIFLLFEKSKENKQTIKDFFKNLKKYPEIYHSFKKHKKPMLMALSGYLLYPMLRKRVIKQMGLKEADL